MVSPLRAAQQADRGDVSLGTVGNSDGRPRVTRGIGGMARHWHRLHQRRPCTASCAHSRRWSPLRCAWLPIDLRAVSRRRIRGFRPAIIKAWSMGEQQPRPLHRRWCRCRVLRQLPVISGGRSVSATLAVWFSPSLASVRRRDRSTTRLRDLGSIRYGPSSCARSAAKCRSVLAVYARFRLPVVERSPYVTTLLFKTCRPERRAVPHAA